MSMVRVQVSVTLDEMEAEITEEFRNEAIRSVEEKDGPIGDDARLKECVIVGEWLSRRLRKNGISESKISKTASAFGQYCFFMNPWLTAIQVYSAVMAGHAIEPGLELANALNDKFIRTENGRKVLTMVPFTLKDARDRLKMLQEAENLQKN